MEGEDAPHTMEAYPGTFAERVGTRKVTADGYRFFEIGFLLAILSVGLAFLNGSLSLAGTADLSLFLLIFDYLFVLGTLLVGYGLCALGAKQFGRRQEVWTKAALGMFLFIVIVDEAKSRLWSGVDLGPAYSIFRVIFVVTPFLLVAYGVGNLLEKKWVSTYAGLIVLYRVLQTLLAPVLPTTGGAAIVLGNGPADASVWPGGWGSS